MAGKSASRGLTLIELAGVLAIVAILGAIALPGYRAALQRGDRAAARAQLMLAAQFMHRFYAANDSYRQSRSGEPVLAAMPQALKQSPAQGPPLYVLDESASQLAQPGEFKLVLKPAGRQAGDACGSFTLDQTNARGVEGNLAEMTREQCWR